MIPEYKFVKNSGIARGAGLVVRPECHHFVSFLFSFESENPLLGSQRPFSSCHHILLDRKPTRIAAKTSFFFGLHLFFGR